MRKTFFWRIRITLAITLCVFMIASCTATSGNTGNETVSEISAANSVSEISTSAAISAEIPTTDRAGNAITIPGNVNTIISLSPASTEMLIDLGLFEKLAAVDAQSALLPSVSAIRSDIPNIDMLAPDAEVILSLSPDIIFASTMSLFSGEEQLRAIQSAGVPVAFIPTSESISAIVEDLRFIAAATGKTAEGDVVAEQFEAEIAAVRKISEAIPEEKRKTVYFEISAAPDLYSFGKDVFLQELLEIAGAKNVFASQSGWLPVSAEDVLSLNPDVILSNDAFSASGDPVSEILSRESFRELTAVKNKDVYYIDSNSSSQPTEGCVLALKQIAKAVYPEYFS